MNGTTTIRLLLAVLVSLIGSAAAAQETPPPPDGWKLDAGLSYLATSGNTDTSSIGLNGDFSRLRGLWTFDAGGSLIRAEDQGELVAEQMHALLRASRDVSPRLAITSGWQGEQNQFAGIDFRSTFDAGVRWKALTRERWTVDTIAAATWIREEPIGFADTDSLGALLSAHSEYRFSATASTTQSLRLQPNFEDSDDYRADLKLTLQSSLSRLFALAVGYELRYDNQPVPGFDETDTLTTASLVFKVERGTLP
ncbi:MAG TPA: DUF481 domain-containing protein [Thermoanaerobaculia bacterium]|nr:DUF481 domain-containing protein [Thermoanaerobaculia bacterium]